MTTQPLRELIAKWRKAWKSEGRYWSAADELEAALAASESQLCPECKTNITKGHHSKLQGCFPAEPRQGRMFDARAEAESWLKTWYEDANAGLPSEAAIESLTMLLQDAAGHCGDCTRQPHTCQRCLVESNKKDAAKLTEKLNALLRSKPAGTK